MKLIKQEFIFGEPLPTPECHASTILVRDDGKKLAAWFAGTKEANPDVLIFVSRFDGESWSTPRAVTPEVDIQHWNPVLFEMNGEVVLFYKMGYPIADWHTRYITSKDFGESWSEPRELVAGDVSGGRGPVKNKPIRISNGNILAPGSTEKGPWRCFVDIFDGKEWRKRNIPVELENAEKVNVIQPTLWESSEGHIHALVRSNIGRIYRSDSKDYGETWSPIYPTDMPNNNSGIDCVKLTDGRIVLLCNPIEKNWGPRTPLSLYISENNGESFQKVLDLETAEGGFAYPSVVEIGGHLHIVYTYNRKKIVYAEIEI